MRQHLLQLQKHLWHGPMIQLVFPPNRFEHPSPPQKTKSILSTTTKIVKNQQSTNIMPTLFLFIIDVNADAEVDIDVWLCRFTFTPLSLTKLPAPSFHPSRVLLEGLFALALTSDLPSVSNRMKTLVEPELAFIMASVYWWRIIMNSDHLVLVNNPWWIVLLLLLVLATS